jgi:energy-coupling factor transport system ATP-binding protein
MKKIVFDNVSWRYSSSNEWALREINADIEEGEVVLVTGPTGAGKTTFCRLINGLVPHGYPGTLRGRVYIDGKDTTALPISKIANFVGSVFEDPESQIVWTNIKDEVIFPLENRRIQKDEMDERINYSLALLGLLDKMDKTPYELSGGQKQRLAIASVIAARPSIIVLDEPTSQLDPVGRREVMEAIKRIRDEYNSTIIIVEHNIDALLNYADKMILLNNGSVAIRGEPDAYYSSIEDVIRYRGPLPECVELSYRLSQITGKKFNCYSAECLKETIERIIDSRVIEIEEREERQPANFGATEEIAIELRDVSFVYADGTRALDQVSTLVRKGEMVGIIGVNGSGKTTLAKTLNGLLKPSFGSIKIFGKDVNAYKQAELVGKVGYVFQNPIHQISCRTVKEEIAFGMKNLGFEEEIIKRNVETLLQRFNLSKFGDAHPYNLSRADQFRVTFASVVAMNPDILVVDEPTTGQDHAQSHEIMNFLQEENKKGKTILVITHHLRFVAQYIQRLMIMLNGKILYDGPTRNAFSNYSLMKSSLIDPPEMSKLSYLLADRGFHGLISVDEFTDRIEELTTF